MPYNIVALAFFISPGSPFESMSVYDAHTMRMVSIIPPIHIATTKSFEKMSPKLALPKGFRKSIVAANETDGITNNSAGRIIFFIMCMININQYTNLFHILFYSTDYSCSMGWMLLLCCWWLGLSYL